MGAIVNLRDTGLRTPDQIIRVFYQMFDAQHVELSLWKVFGKLALAVENDDEESWLLFEEVSLLFDQLISLTKAVESLLEKPPECCPVCGRCATVKNGEG